VFGAGEIASHALLAAVPDHAGAARTLACAVLTEVGGLSLLAITGSTPVAISALLMLALGQGLCGPPPSASSHSPACHRATTEQPRGILRLRRRWQGMSTDPQSGSPPAPSTSPRAAIGRHRSARRRPDRNNSPQGSHADGLVGQRRMIGRTGQIRVGDEWHPDIIRAVERSSVALLLVSADSWPRISS
jgi:hypothetical protein